MKIKQNSKAYMVIEQEKKKKGESWVDSLSLTWRQRKFIQAVMNLNTQRSYC